MNTSGQDVGRRDQRNQSMIFGLGMSKTGTTSLLKALRILGHSATHFPTERRDIERLEKGQFALGRLKKYEAIVDSWPLVAWRWLAREYQDAQFVLTIRDEQEWLDSCEAHFCRNSFRGDSARYYYRVALFGCVEFNRDHFLDRYRSHICAVQDFFARRAERLLVLNVCAGEGWSPLCSFLGKPIPDIPFPHTNQRPR